MTWREHDTLLRSAAFQHVQSLQRRYGDAIPWQAIEQGVLLRGERHFLASKAEGIYKPAMHPAVLSIKTTVPRLGRRNPYADEISPDGSVFRYAYRRGGPEDARNEGLRVVAREGLPILYFFGVEVGLYAVIAPLFVVDDDRAAEMFSLAPNPALGLFEGGQHARDERGSLERRYAPRIVLQRLHQQAFRSQVLAAYDHHCAMCSIHFDDLLDAAHIVPDRHALGVPDVRNGLALCGLHHRAFDRHLIDVDDAYRIQLSPALLRRRNGPLFQQAFLDRHREPLHLPKSPRARPSLDFLHTRRSERPDELWAL